ncbi:MAG: S49 family peptidase [Leptospiraceae bacterium]|nr:S49 family peptidase [Leptospiraceae bacterium]
MLFFPSSFSSVRKTTALQLIEGKDKSYTLLEYLQLLESLKSVKSLKKVSIFVDRLDMGFAELYSVTEVLKTLKETGITLSAYAIQGDLKSLYLLSFCQERYSLDSGEFHVLLPSMEPFFFGGLISEKLEMEVENYASGKYKSFAEIFTRKGFSKESKENLNNLISSLRLQIEQTFYQNTQIDPEILKTPILSSEKLKKLGFFQRLFDDEMYVFNYLFPEYGSDEEDDEPQYRNLSMKQLKRLKKFQSFSVFPPKKEKLLVLPLKGNIVTGKKEEGNIKAGSIQAYSLRRLIREIREDDSVKAVIVEIDSGGGSAFASELIYREIAKLAATKLTCAYFQNASASGGYYIAAACNQIYSNPFCITGSIGTVMVRPNFKGLYQKLGISKDRLGFYPLRDVFSEYGKLSPKSKKFVIDEIERNKNIFYSRVMRSRSKTKEELFELAEGRVFTGKDFHEKGMLDGILPLQDLISNIKEKLGFKKLVVEYLSPVYDIQTFINDMNLMKQRIPKSLLKVSEEIFNYQDKGFEYKSYISEHIVNSIKEGSF